MSNGYSPEEFAKFFGIMLGDGCISRGVKHRTISVVGNIYDDGEFFEQVVIPLAEKIRGKHACWRKRPERGAIELKFSDKEMFNLFKNEGFPVGKKGLELTIPKKFLKRDMAKLVVAGIFATDGSLVLTNNNGVLYPRIEFRSISRPLLHQIRSILSTVGMKGGLYEKYYRLQYNGKGQLKLFEEGIGFLNPKHQKKSSNFRCRRSSVG